METFDLAFKSNGGIGGFFDGNYPNRVAAPDVYPFEYVPYSVTRFMFDNIYNILILVIFMQIFSGIIIDTFGSLRERDAIKQEDKSQICFICGYDRESFDRKSDGGFNIHIKNEHNIWEYIFLIGYLKDKDYNELNGME